MKKSKKKQVQVMDSSDSNEFNSEQGLDSDDSFENVSVRDPLNKKKNKQKGGNSNNRKGKGANHVSSDDESIHVAAATGEGDGYNEGDDGSGSELVESLMFESNGFDKDALDEAIEERKKHMLNKHLTKMEKEIYLAIKYGDSNKLRDLGGGE